MKKFTALLLALLLIFSLTACSEQPTETTTVAQKTSAAPATTKAPATTEKTTAAPQTTAAPEVKNDDPIIVGQTWVVGSLDPVAGSASWALTSHGVAEYVYMQDKDGALKSRFIKELKQVDELDWEAVMKEGVKFSDGSDVDAKAFCEAMNIIFEENELSNATAGKIVFTPTGDYAFTIKTERPTKLMMSVFSEWTNVVFKRLEDGSYIFTGPYVVDSFDAGTELKVKPNPYYPNAENRSDLIIKAFKDVSAMKLAIESGEIDMAFTVTPAVAKMLKDSGVIVESIYAGYQYFAPVNLMGVLKDQNLRTAINFGLNREDYQKVIMGGELPTGVFARYYPFAGEDEMVFDLEKANQLLDEAGYELKDGTRYKDGAPLKLKIVTYSFRPDLPVLMQVLATQLKAMGIDSETAIVDNIGAELKKGEFDIALYAQHTAPTGNPAFFLNQFFRTDGANNHMKYSSAELDAKLDEMALLPLGDDMNAKAKEVQHIIATDLPIFYLLDPMWHIGVSERLNGYLPYCGDYFIINDQLIAK